MGLPPAFALVVGAIDFAPHATVVADDVKNIRVGGRDGDAHSANLLTGGKPLGQKLPRLARVGRLVDSAAGTGDDIIPSLPVALPGNGIQCLVVGRVDGDFHDTNLLRDIEDLLPGLPPSVVLNTPRCLL